MSQGKGGVTQSDKIIAIMETVLVGASSLNWLTANHATAVKVAGYDAKWEERGIGAGSG